MTTRKAGDVEDHTTLSGHTMPISSSLRRKDMQIQMYIHKVVFSFFLKEDHHLHGYVLFIIFPNKVACTYTEEVFS